MQELYCLYCENLAAGEKIKFYKDLDCDKAWNTWPLCREHDSRRRWAPVKEYLKANGWKHSKGWRRVNASDWTYKGGDNAKNV